MDPSIQLAIILGSTVVAFVLGIVFGNTLRMPEHGWKLGVIFGSLALGISLCSLREAKQGIDLRGGVILIYEVDAEKTSQAAIAQSGGELTPEDTDVQMPELVQALSRRINPGGVREVVIRPYGERQVEIIIPDVSDSEISEIKRSITSAGFLKFRIVAHKDRNPYQWELAENSLKSDDINVRNGSFVKDKDGTVIGEWVTLGRTDTTTGDGALPPLRFSAGQLATMLTRETEPGRVEAFVLVDDPEFNVEGRHLRTISASRDESGRPKVDFQMTSEGAALFGRLTSLNLPDEAGIPAPLGIIMDNVMLSAPGIQSTIQSRGEITGQFTDQEVDFLVRVLRAGRLPAVLKEEPISENQINPLLGEDTIRKGKFAIGSSILAVLLFMLIYYRFAGVVACLAVITNLILIWAMMILIGAAFSLPGLAGLVLTVGMSVDANVLIFERIREELKKGCALRMAIRNGFGRAMSTIVDANVTTLITAIVLYVVGTETIKGFAITLILGILTSMYTAIFCSRVIFEIAERKKWITSLTMSAVLGDTNIDFLRMKRFAIPGSLLAIVLGLTAVAFRGGDILDIDFTGGTSLQVVLDEPMETAQVRAKLKDIAESVSVTEVKPEDQPENTVYKIDTNLSTESDLQNAILSVFGEQLATHSMEFTNPARLTDDESGLATATKLNFDEKLSKMAVEKLIASAADREGVAPPRVSVSHPTWDGIGDDVFASWDVKLSLDPDGSQSLLADLQSEFAKSPLILSSSKIGSKVAGDMKSAAVMAIIVSLLGIVGYIWIRFQRVGYGLAAVIALVHDVSITLGAVALSLWLSKSLGWLLIDEFRISLPIVAAFLTIIGYSLNDTIVVFDRIREVKGKSPHLTAEMINYSINHTLSRTILTSLTTLIVVIILYIFGGQGIHGFAFALLVGIVVGTYSSIFIASPALLWLTEKKVSSTSPAKKFEKVQA